MKKTASAAAPVTHVLGSLTSGVPVTPALSDDDYKEMMETAVTPAKPQDAIIEELLAAKIKEAHNNVCQALRSSLDHARAAGEWLSLVRAKMNYKEWVQWCQEKCGLSESTATNYKRIHENWKEVQNEENYTAALKALRKTRKVSEAEEETAPLSPWEAKVKQKMMEHKIKGKLVNIKKFLADFGVNPQ